MCMLWARCRVSRYEHSSCHYSAMPHLRGVWQLEKMPFVVRSVQTTGWTMVTSIVTPLVPTVLETASWSHPCILTVSQPRNIMKYPPAVWASNVCLPESGTRSLASWQMSEDLIFDDIWIGLKTFKDIQGPKSNRIKKREETSCHSVRSTKLPNATSVSWAERIACAKPWKTVWKKCRTLQNAQTTLND